jgi:hypothetical protein
MPSRRPDSSGKRKKKRKLKTRLEDSRLVRIIERVPVLGFVASAGHGVAALVTGRNEEMENGHWKCFLFGLF